MRAVLLFAPFAVARHRSPAPFCSLPPACFDFLQRVPRPWYPLCDADRPAGRAEHVQGQLAVPPAQEARKAVLDAGLPPRPQEAEH